MGTGRSNRGRRLGAFIDRRTVAGRSHIPPRLDVGQLDWMDQAACVGVGPHPFYVDPASRSDGPSPQAMAACINCPVRQRCLDYALIRDERFGVWGGLSYRQRVQLRRAPDDQRPELYRQLLVANCRQAAIALPKELCPAS